MIKIPKTYIIITLICITILLYQLSVVECKTSNKDKASSGLKKQEAELKKPAPKANNNNNNNKKKDSDGDGKKKDISAAEREEIEARKRARQARQQAKKADREAKKKANDEAAVAKAKKENEEKKKKEEKEKKRKQEEENKRKKQKEEEAKAKEKASTKKASDTPSSSSSSSNNNNNAKSKKELEKEAEDNKRNADEYKKRIEEEARQSAIKDKEEREALKQRVRSESSSNKNDAARKARLRAQETKEKELERRYQRLNVKLTKAKQRNQKLKSSRIERLAKRKKQNEKLKSKQEVGRKRLYESQQKNIIRRGLDKAEWMYEASMSAPYNIIELNYSQLKKYLHETPRPYHVFLSLTALDKQYKCSLCTTALKSYRKLAVVYNDHRDRTYEELENVVYNMSSTINAYNMGNIELLRDFRKKMPIFFAQCDIEKCRELFHVLNLQSAPTMIVIPPTAAAAPSPIASFLSSLPSNARFVLQKMDISAGDLHEFVQKATHVEVALVTKRKGGWKGFLQGMKDTLGLMDPVRKLVITVAIAMISILGILSAFKVLFSKVLLRMGLLSDKKSYEDSLINRQSLYIYSHYASQLSKLSWEEEDKALIKLNKTELHKKTDDHGDTDDTQSENGTSTKDSINEVDEDKKKRGYFSSIHYFTKHSSLGLFRYWCVVSGFLIYLFGISGGMFNVLRGNSSWDWKGWKIDQYIIHDGHDQSSIEGFAMGCLQLACATLLIFLNKMSFTYRNIQKEENMTTSNKIVATLLRWFIGLLVSPLIWGTLFYLVWNQIISIYSSKNGGYHHGFVWKHMPNMATVKRTIKLAVPLQYRKYIPW